MTLEDQEGLLSQVDLFFQLIQADLCLLFDLSFQGALRCLEGLVLLGIQMCP